MSDYEKYHKIDRIVEVAFFGPTNTKGARWRVRGGMLAHTHWIDYQYDLNAITRVFAAAEEAAKQEGLNYVAYLAEELPCGVYAVVLMPIKDSHDNDK